MVYWVMSTEVIFRDGIAGKLCPQCPAPGWQPLINFGRNKCHADGFQTYCKACKHAEYIKYRGDGVAFREVARRRQLAYQAANPEKVREQRRGINARRRASHLEETRAIVRASVVAWRKKYPERGRLVGANAKAKRRAAEGRFTLAELDAVRSSQAGLCYYCGKLMGEEHIEHKTPISRGGTNYITNICLACPPCNLSKHTKTEAEFRTATGL